VEHVAGPLRQGQALRLDPVGVEQAELDPLGMD
jgi:hypothetical protein